MEVVRERVSVVKPGSDSLTEALGITRERFMFLESDIKQMVMGSDSKAASIANIFNNDKLTTNERAFFIFALGGFYESGPDPLDILARIIAGKIKKGEEDGET